MARTKSIRSQKQFTRIYGLKVAKSVYTRAVKGNYKSGYAPLVKNILKYNEEKIKKAGWISGEALFKEMHATFKEDGTEDNIKNMLEFVRKGMNTHIVEGTSKEVIFKRNLGAILEESLSKEDLAGFLAENNVTQEELPYYFNDWSWDSSKKRWEGPDGHWIKIDKINLSNYEESEITYGTV